MAMNILRNTILCAAFLLCNLTLSSCATLRTSSDFDRTENFSAFHTFSWMPRTEFGTDNPLVVQRARDAIQATLAQKGYQYAADTTDVDFLVDFTIGSRERIDVESYPAPYYGPYWGYRGWWGYRYWGPAVDVHTYREGTLSVDIFDARTHRPVWHGWAKKELTPQDIERSDQVIATAVNELLSQYPPH